MRTNRVRHRPQGACIARISVIPQKTRDAGQRHPLFNLSIDMCDKEECINKLRQNIPYIQKKYKVSSLLLFGSVARGDNRQDSDIDILVEMPPKILLMSALKEYLETLLLNSVDLVRKHAHLSERFLNQVSIDAISIL